MRKKKWNRVLAALLAGYDNGIGDVFAFSRCLVFFPWFVLGWMCNVDKLEYQLHRPVMQILAPVTVLAFFIICRLNIDSFYIFRRFFTGRSSYEALLDDAGEVGILFRLSAYMITFIIGVCILSIIPRHKIFHLDALGKESMSIYFFHRPVLFYLEYVETYPFLYQHFHGWANILWLIIAIILVIILAQPLFEKPFKIYNAWIQQRVHVS